MPTDDSTLAALKAELRATGRISRGRWAGRRIMILTTTGAKSGQPREALVTFSRDGDRYVIGASRRGAPINPDWYHNLVAHPKVIVEADRERFAAQATVTSGAERDRLFKQHAAERSTFEEYQKMTTRVIPMIVLDRLDA